MSNCVVLDEKEDLVPWENTLDEDIDINISRDHTYNYKDVYDDTLIKNSKINILVNPNKKHKYFPI